jgi:hypothetical protein
MSVEADMGVVIIAFAILFALAVGGSIQTVRNLNVQYGPKHAWAGAIWAVVLMAIIGYYVIQAYRP